MNVIPGKQLLTSVGTLSELSPLLLDRELGWCEETHSLYYKKGNEVVPVSQSVVLPENASREDILAAMSAGKVPVIKVPDGTGFRYLYPETITPDSILFFADGMSDGASSSSYMTMAPDGTRTHHTIGEMTDPEVSALVDALE